MKDVPRTEARQKALMKAREIRWLIRQERAKSSTCEKRGR